MVIDVEADEGVPANEEDTETSTGADGAMIYYADEKNIIFGGSFGIYEYNIENEEIEVSYLNLDAIGCSYTQGEHYCEVSVSKDGSYVYLHPIDSDSMYRLNMTYAADIEKMSAKKLPEKKKIYQGSDTETASYVDGIGANHEITLVNRFGMVGDVCYVKDNDKTSQIRFFPNSNL
jgi:hypothetical protein